jgi:hypothetical protein
MGRTTACSRPDGASLCSALPEVGNVTEAILFRPPGKIFCGNEASQGVCQCGVWSLAFGAP